MIINRTRNVIVSTLIAIVIILAVSAPVLAYSFYTIMRVTESANTTYGQLAVTANVNSQWLADYGYIRSDALDLFIETTSGAPIPSMVASDRITAAIPLPMATSNQYLVKLGVTPIRSSFSIVPGYGGYVTTPDAASLELGDNFTITMNDIYIDTDNGTDKNIIYKPGAFRVYVSSAGNVTASILVPEADRAPDGAGSETNVAGLAGAATHWQAMLTNDGDTSFIVDSGGGYQRDLYSTADTAVTGEIESVKITVVAKAIGGGAALKTAVSTNGTVYDGAETLAAGVYTSNSTTYYTNPDTGSRWTFSEVNDMEIGVSLKNACRVTQIYANVYFAAAHVTLTGITSGEYDVTVSANTTHLTLDIGGTSNSTALSGASVPDNANDLILFENNSVAYCDSFVIEVAGTEQLRYQPNDIISGTTLPDRTVTNNGTITWGTNPAGVTVTMDGLLPTGAIDLPESELESSRDVLREVRSYWVGEMDVEGLRSNPIYPFISAVTVGSGLSDFTEQQVWVFIGTAAVILLTLAGIMFFPGHVFIAGMCCAAGIAGCIMYYQIYPPYTMFIAIAIIIVTLVFERTNSF